MNHTKKAFNNLHGHFTHAVEREFWPGKPKCLKDKVYQARKLVRNVLDEFRLTNKVPQRLRFRSLTLVDESTWISLLTELSNADLKYSQHADSLK